MSPWSKTIKIVCARPGGDINEVKREKKNWPQNMNTQNLCLLKKQLPKGSKNTLC